MAARSTLAALLAGFAIMHPAALGARDANDAPVAAIALPFAPPVDVALDYRIEQAQPGLKGDELSFSRRFRLQFTHAGRGFRLDVTLIEVAAQAPDRMVSAFRAALQPLLGTTIGYRLSSDGRTVYLDDPVAVRAALDQIVEQIARAGSNGGDVAIARAAVAHLSRLDDEEMTQLLFEDVRPVLQFAQSRVEESPADLVTEGFDLADSPVTGVTHLAIVDSDAASVRIRETTRTARAASDDGAASRIVSTLDYTVDRATGLATRIDQRDTLGGDAGRIVSRKTRTIVPAGP